MKVKVNEEIDFTLFNNEYDVNISSQLLDILKGLLCPDAYSRLSVGNALKME